MEAIGLFFSKFSDELVSAQVALLSLALALAFYWMLIRGKKREKAEWVPAALVRAYLDRVRADERETRMRLFGEESASASASAPAAAGMPLARMLTGTPGQAGSGDPGLAKEVEALRAQLAMADGRAMEFDRAMNGLRAEKSAIEQKLKEAQAAPAGAAPASAGPDPQTVKELEELRAKLQEYAVIEDDLANLKKFQKENEQLRQKIGQLEGGGAPALTVVQGGAASAEPVTAVSGNAPKAPEAVAVVSEAKPAAEPVAAVPAPAPAETAPAPDPAPAALAAAPAEPTAAAAPSPETNTNVLAPITPGADATAATAAAPAETKSSKQKEEDLLSEFEKMLAS